MEWYSYGQAEGLGYLAGRSGGRRGLDCALEARINRQLDTPRSGIKIVAILAVPFWPRRCFVRQLEYTVSEPGANMQISARMPGTRPRARKDIRVVLPFCVLLLGLAGLAQARVTHITISKTAPAFNGQSFGKVGAYEVCLLYTSPSPRD